MTSDIPGLSSLSVHTSTSLLMRVKSFDQQSWQQLVRLYGPMVYRWIRKAGIQPSDSQDVVQNVFLTVSADIAKFRRTKPGDSFRGWLWTITRHKILDCFRERRRRTEAIGGSDAKRLIEQIVVPEPDQIDQSSEIGRVRHRAVEMLRPLFDKPVWEAFVRTTVHGDKPADVARDLGLSLATVYRAKYRVLTRLQIELDGL